MKSPHSFVSNKSLALALALGAGVVLLGGCSAKAEKEGRDHAGHDHANEANDGATRYQCSMHPNVVSDEPGACPICAMDLQPALQTKEKGIPGRAPVRLTDKQRQLINIRTVPAASFRAIKSLEAPGVVRHDDSKVFTVAAWTAGRVERLRVDKPEAYVEKGDVLYEIYSPNLYAAAQEYVRLLEGQNPRPRLVETALDCPHPIGLDPAQIDALADADEVPLTFPIKSPVSGIVMKKLLREGAYVEEGDKLYTVVDLSSLWLIAEIYETDLPFVSPGQRVVATTPAVPGVSFLGAVELVNHHIDPTTRTAELRIVFNNPMKAMHPLREGETRRHHRLLPDMWMNARIERDLGERLSIPRSALFDTGRRQYVFVETEQGLFAPKIVEAGPRIGDRVLVDAGLEEGQRVVVDGVFLLDSESLLKATAFEEAPAASAAGADVPASNAAAAATESGRAGTPAVGLSSSAETALDAFWTAYFELRDALADDSVEDAREGFRELRSRIEALREPERLPVAGKAAWLQGLEATRKRAALPEDAGIAALRDKFGHLSAAVIDWASAAPDAATRNLKVASCPMWTSSPGQWVMAGDEIENPFMGAAMLRCGTIDRPLAEGDGQ